MRAAVLAQSSAGPYVDRTPELPPAGIVSLAPKSFIQHPTDASASAILSDSNAPPTPDRVSRFRRDARFPLGASAPTLRDAPPNIAFGVKTKASESAADILHGDASRANVQSRLLALREQATYASAQREPLGQVPVLGRAPPEAQHMVHGTSTNFGESVKSVLYAPSDSLAGPRTLSDGRTFGRMEAGQQRRRGYEWGAAAAAKGENGINLHTHTFGRAPEAIAEGVGATMRGTLPPIPPKARATDAAAAAMGSSRLATVVGGGGLPATDGPYRTVVKPRQDLHPGMRRSDPPVGVGVPRGSAPDDVKDGRVFGKMQRDDGLSAAVLVHSGWSDAQAAPDPSVGRCLRRGPVKRVAPHAGAPSDIAAGVATVRHDKPTPVVRKVTDFTTYGDALAAGSLIAPPKYGELGVSEEDFLRQRGRAEMEALTEAAAFNLSAEEFEFCWAIASEGGPTASIEAFRRTCDAHFV